MGRPEDSSGRRDFLAHDIRAAVADVIGGLRLVDTASLPAPAREQCTRVRVAAELIARLVEELLGDAPRPLEAFGALELDRFLLDELRRWQAVGRPIETEVKLIRGPGLPNLVRLDGLRLRRIVANLMGNAMRYADGGSVELRAEAAEDGSLSISVCDDGPGFPPEVLSRGAPGAPTGASEPDGAGMGLRIARFHVAELSGEMTLRNLPDGGAQVVVTIPAHVWKAPEQGGGAVDLTGRRVLVADDSGTTRTLTAAMLARLGMECEGARDGIDALNLFSRERFDLALIDLEMPRLGGLDVIRSVRRRQDRGIAPPMRIIAMTAHPGSQVEDEIRDAGADGILAKPLPELDVFGRVLAGFLSGAPDLSDWTPAMAPPFNRELLTELMGLAGEEGTTLFARLIDDLDAADTALGQALTAGDLDGMHAQSHVLLSLGGTIGAIPLQEASARLLDLSRARDVTASGIAAKVCLGRLGELRAALRALP
ncbi:response regulator [Jannaschia seohaensis]|uniref:histidine kinase n=1 Tax=Jannaschia seohaensis TaxID=475081 RepID=A0A2Y9ABN4_9RHOB|nr:response regulator [Jannaschia seohaensis]PWJ21185.1 histidine kinase/DNA gyrase B/HSP90-like ATPase [Jannaschia seohaensis]SSA41595.1 Histidine kinase-, DNA gyrase B-, and HSP90-like ATPase [Jannaschia seohaensis]